MRPLLRSMRGDNTPDWLGSCWGAGHQSDEVPTGILAHTQRAEHDEQGPWKPPQIYCTLIKLVNNLFIPLCMHILYACAVTNHTFITYLMSITITLFSFPWWRHLERCRNVGIRFNNHWLASKNPIELSANYEHIANLKRVAFSQETRIVPNLSQLSTGTVLEDGIFPDRCVWNWTVWLFWSHFNHVFRNHTKPCIPFSC